MSVRRKILDKEVNMTKKVEPLPLRQSDDGTWEVKNDRGIWIKCENEEDAKILSNAPIVLQEGSEVFYPNEKAAAMLDRTAEKMEQYNMRSGSRYFRAMAERARGNR
ncbi:MAG: hypothetical protein PHQ35_05625 [Phycisphaerae bacterium]|nr:hypothetical protein [Phycisphaerae bacterium]